MTGGPLTVVMLGNQSSIHVRRWSEALAARGHTIVPLDLRGLRRSPWRRVRDFLELRLALQAALRAPRTVVALHGLPDGLLASGLRGLHPLVASAWGSDVTRPADGPTGRWRAAQLGAFLRAADARTVTSRYLAATIERRFGVAAEVVPIGVDLDQFRPLDGPRPPGPVRFVFTKWLAEIYGPDVFLAALARLGSEPAWEAVIAGDGPWAGRLSARATELGLGDRVRFAGRLPHDEIPALLRAADVLVMPSRREAFGVAALEAAACGLPVVASDVGGVAETVVDGRTGLLVPPGDPAALAAALARLAADPDLRARLGAAGRERTAELYAWARCVERLERVYLAAATR